MEQAKKIDLNKFYKLLDTFEKETKTYSEGKPIANVEAGRISTASRDLTKLAQLGLIFSHGKGRSIYYTKV